MSKLWRDEARIKQTAKDTINMSQFLSKLGLRYVGSNFYTAKKHLARLGVDTSHWKGGGSNPETHGHLATPLHEILEGKHPQFKTYHLKNKLIKAGLKHNVCERCGIGEWLDRPLMCHLDHVDGNSTNHRLENLRILCPNCHSQTETYAGKNKKSTMPE